MATSRERNLSLDLLKLAMALMVVGLHAALPRPLARYQQMSQSTIHGKKLVLRSFGFAQDDGRGWWLRMTAVGGGPE